MRRLIPAVLIFLSFAFAMQWLIPTIRAQDSSPTPSMIMPVAGEPGPDTWLFGQAYGNTTGSFNFGQDWYSAGQGLHFGIDLPMPCGTELVAVADGEVLFADNLSFGAGPHNLLIYHPAQNVVSLYGHLLQRPDLNPTEPVYQGQVVGLSGDPDGTCNSRPHLHFEIRAQGYRTAYNPVPFIAANWDMLTSIGAYGYPLFQQDMQNPRRWMSVYDQPDVQFGGRILNRYSYTWPPPSAQRAPSSAQPLRELPPLPIEAEWRLEKIAPDGCCAVYWWDAIDPAALYVIDGSPGQNAAVMRWDIDNGVPAEWVELAPPTHSSPDGRLQVTRSGNATIITDSTKGQQVSVNTSGQLPAVSPDNQRLLWEVSSGRYVPGGVQPPVSVWVSDVNGSNGRLATAQRGGSVSWLDAERVLLSVPTEDLQIRTLTVLDLRDDSRVFLGTYRTLRNLSIAPGGGHLLYYLAFQDDPAQNGVYLLGTAAGSTPQALDWFGSWRWRDASTLYVLPFDPSTNQHSLAYYDINSGDFRRLFRPEEGAFSVMNGQWEVNADGTRIVFQNSRDGALWMLSYTP